MYVKIGVKVAKIYIHLPRIERELIEVVDAREDRLTVL